MVLSQTTIGFSHPWGDPLVDEVYNHILTSRYRRYFCATASDLEEKGPVEHTCSNGLNPCKCPRSLTQSQSPRRERSSIPKCLSSRARKRKHATSHPRTACQCHERCKSVITITPWRVQFTMQSFVKPEGCVDLLSLLAELSQGRLGAKIMGLTAVVVIKETY